MQCQQNCARDIRKHSDSFSAFRDLSSEYQAAQSVASDVAGKHAIQYGPDPAASERGSKNRSGHEGSAWFERADTLSSAYVRREGVIFTALAVER